MPHSPTADNTRLWPRAYVWIWLVVNVVWLQLVIPFWIVSNDVVVLNPDVGFTRKLVAGVIAIVVIPFLGVLGFALLTLHVLRWADRMVTALR